MVRRIKITLDQITVEAELNETHTASVVWDGLPIEATANTWGDEIYFSTSIVLGLEAGQDVVERGDLGYWPPGKAVCLFFGPTPSSRGDEIRPASPVTVFGRILGDTSVLKSVRDGSRVKLVRQEG
jgi:hypothetical protein